MMYVGLDVHEETTVASFRNAAGQVVKREVVATSPTALRGMFRGLRGSIRIALESGPQAVRVVAILSTKHRHVLVCDGRRNRLLASGTKTDSIDADKLSDLLRLGALRPVYIGDAHVQQLRCLVHHYSRVTGDRTRALLRLRALLASIGVRVKGRTSLRTVSLRAVREPSVRFVARALVEQIKFLTPVLQAAKTRMVAHAATDPMFVLLQSCPYIGPIRAAELLAIVGDAHRFPTSRSFCAYGGLAVEQRVSSEHRIANGKFVRQSGNLGVRRLNRNGNPRLKSILKDVALGASLGRGVLRSLYEAHIERGKRPAIARVALARRIASIIYSMWKSAEPFTPERLKSAIVCSGRASTDPLVLGPCVSPKVRR